MMTWAPCPHGVRTRGKKTNKPEQTRNLGQCIGQLHGQTVGHYCVFFHALDADGPAVPFLL